MSSVEAPMSLEQNGDYKVFDLCRKMLYWQGFWHDEDEEAEPDLEFYLKYFSPRSARLLAKHRLLRLPLRQFRRFNRLFLISTISVQVFYLYPMGMYVYKSNALDAATNYFGFIIEGIKLAAICTVYFQPRTLHSIFAEMDAMLGPEQLDNEEQREIYDKTRSLCQMIVKRIQTPVLFVLNVAYVLDYFFNLLPYKRFFFKEWYPWDTTLSPAYEITLFSRMIQIMSSTSISLVLVSVLFIVLIMPRSNLKILNNKLENVKNISIKRIKARKLKNSIPLAENTIVTFELEVSRQVGSALPGGHFRAGPAAYNARRVVSLELMSHDAYELGSTSGREEMPLGSVLQGGQLRAGPAAYNVRKVDSLALLRPLCNSVRAVIPTETSQAPPAHLPQDNLEGMRTSQVVGTPRDGQLGNTLEGVSTAELNKEMQDSLKECIQLHVKLIRYIGLFNKYINGFLIVMFLANTLVLGVTALLFSKPDGINSFKVQGVVFCAMITMVYLIVNNVMQLVTDQHEAVCESVYNSDWTGASPSFKKSMLVIMSRANVPLEMKPTGLDPVSRKNFAQVMNGAYKMVNTLNTIVK